MKNNHRKINFYTQRQPFAVRVLLLIAVSLASGIPNVSATSEANQESSLPSPSRRQQQPERNVGSRIFEILKSSGEESNDNVIQQGEASDAEDAQKIIEQWLDQALKAMIDEMIQQGEAGIPPGCILAPAPDSEIKDSRAKTNFQPCQNFILKLAGYKSIIACLEALERDQQK